MISSYIDSPTDSGCNGFWEDPNDNQRKDYDEVVFKFDQMEQIVPNESLNSFDFEGNGRRDFNNIVTLFLGGNSL